MALAHLYIAATSFHFVQYFCIPRYALPDQWTLDDGLFYLRNLVSWVITGTKCFFFSSSFLNLNGLARKGSYYGTLNIYSSHF